MIEIVLTIAVALAFIFGGIAFWVLWREFINHDLRIQERELDDHHLRVRDQNKLWAKLSEHDRKFQKIARQHGTRFGGPKGDSSNGS